LNTGHGERNILHTTNRREAKCIGHVLCGDCLLRHVIDGMIEGRIEMMRRRGRRSEQLLDGVKETRG